ncbi:hypothetical protein K8O68_02060 [Salipaludibacillus sp. CUR1]|uniref:hypothetical protein n=1 Tax=Salipaludibacillus sp. CUR1 TaxID=2820003 RepID=UPI001E4498C7|nr:hypothetical protein [Salipaludibacillus sp. CUR1]MCE7791202.1 hypothetical protein [Salipaludibacillus sp. CUR1]
MEKLIIVGSGLWQGFEVIPGGQADLLASTDSGTYSVSLNNLTAITTAYEHIVLDYPVMTGDELVQGNMDTFNSMLTRLLKIISAHHYKNLYIYKYNRLHLLYEGEPPPLEGLNLKKFKQQPKLSAMPGRRVTSVQCWTSGYKGAADDWADTYYEWLNKFTKGMVRVERKEEKALFKVPGVPSPLLILKRKYPLLSKEISEWAITGGLLNGEKKETDPQGRLWFITCSNGSTQTVWTALTHFKPALPWFFYKKTQGLIHPWVMNTFGKRSSR